MKNEVLKQIKKHIRVRIIFIIILFLLFGVPLIINLSFKTKAPLEVLEAKWEASDMLAYYGAVLSFLGTVSLGAVSLYQNHVIQKAAEEKAAILEQREYEKNMPKFILRGSRSNGGACNIVCALRNISENISTDITVYNIKIINPGNDDEVLWESNDKIRIASIKGGDYASIEFKNPVIGEVGSILSCEIRANDKYENQHSYIARGVFEKVGKIPKFNITELK